MGMDVDMVFGKRACDDLVKLISSLPHGERTEIVNDVLKFVSEMQRKWEPDEVKRVEHILRFRFNNFKTEFNESTLMGYIREFDAEGRPLRPDPNWQTDYCLIGEDRFTIIKQAWNVYIFKRVARYNELMGGNIPEDIFLQLDITPDYIK